MKNVMILALSAILSACAASDGADGSNGARGPQGAKGDTPGVLTEIVLPGCTQVDMNVYAKLHGHSVKLYTTNNCTNGRLAILTLLNDVYVLPSSDVLFYQKETNKLFKLDLN